MIVQGWVAYGWPQEGWGSAVALTAPWITTTVTGTMTRYIFCDVEPRSIFIAIKIRGCHTGYSMTANRGVSEQVEHYFVVNYKPSPMELVMRCQLLAPFTNLARWNPSCAEAVKETLLVSYNYPIT